MHTKPVGRPFRSKLTQAQVDEIRSARGVTIGAIAAHFGISESHVRKIRSGENWRPDKRDPKILTPDEVRKLRALRGLRTAAAPSKAIRYQPICRVSRADRATNER